MPATMPANSYQTAVPQRRKRRVFLWVFLAIQVIFIIWIITGIAATAHTAPTAAQMAQYCGTGPKSVLALYSSKASCMTHYSQALSDAAGAGRGIGVAAVVLFWCVVDFLVGGGYAIYRLARRH
jgi:hypothetical protein